MKFDYIIKNATIVDGTGTLPFSGDIGISGEQIAEIGCLSATDAEKVLDAEKAVAFPGFIDVHAHSETSIIKNPNAIHKISQGITMEITGHCGDSCYPSKNPTNTGSFADLDSYRAIVNRQGMSSGPEF